MEVTGKPPKEETNEETAVISTCTYLKGYVEGYEAQNDTQDEAFPENVVELFTWSEYLAKTTEELITWSEYLTEKGADQTKEETKEVNTVIPNDHGLLVRY